MYNNYSSDFFYCPLSPPPPEENCLIETVCWYHTVMILRLFYLIYITLNFKTNSEIH